MTTYYCMCDDVVQLLSDFPELQDPENATRWKLKNLSGGHTHYNGNTSIKALSSIEGEDLQKIKDKDYIHVAEIEDIFGQRVQSRDDDGNLMWDDPIEHFVAGHFRQVPVYGDGDPVYVKEVVEEPLMIKRDHDEDGNPIPEVWIPSPTRTVKTFVDTEEINYYEQVITGYTDGDWVDDYTWYEEVPQWDEIPGDPALRAKYDAIWDQTPYTDEEGNTINPPKVFLELGPTEHLL